MSSLLLFSGQPVRGRSQVVTVDIWGHITKEVSRPSLLTSIDLPQYTISQTTVEVEKCVYFAFERVLPYLVS